MLDLDNQKSDDHGTFTGSLRMLRNPRKYNISAGKAVFQNFIFLVFALSPFLGVKSAGFGIQGVYYIWGLVWSKTVTSENVLLESECVLVMAGITRIDTGG